jgi:hypothetical protein
MEVETLQISFKHKESSFKLVIKSRWILTMLVVLFGTLAPALNSTVSMLGR